MRAATVDVKLSGISPLRPAIAGDKLCNLWRCCATWECCATVSHDGTIVNSYEMLGGGGHVSYPGALQIRTRFLRVGWA